MEQPSPPQSTPADTQLAMLTELVRHSPPDSRGFIAFRREELVETLERIRHDHKQEMQVIPNIAGRLVRVLAEAT
ncbi:MAG TPA: hypothetical protein VGC63_05005 [Solirubrobacterales bacterium]